MPCASESSTIQTNKNKTSENVIINQNGLRTRAKTVKSCGQSIVLSDYYGQAFVELMDSGMRAIKV